MYLRNYTHGSRQNNALTTVNLSLGVTVIPSSAQEMPQFTRINQGKQAARNRTANTAKYNACFREIGIKKAVEEKEGVDVL